MTRPPSAWANTNSNAKPETEASPLANAALSETQSERPTPIALFGPLFVAVQEARIFPDSKTFVDAEPLRDPAAIMADYSAEPPCDNDALIAFVEANFTLPDPGAAPVLSDSRPPIAEHINALWDHLSRPAFAAQTGSSKLSMPAPYVVPGGRFREVYYWDSYFTMLGLRADNRDDLIEGMVDDFVSLIERYGHIPNGNRSYYITRSQPPFFYAMVGLSQNADPEARTRRLGALQREYAFWMSAPRTVPMPDGAVLNRYGSSVTFPREESWIEDAELQEATGRADEDIHPHIRAAAESGWDFGSRWLANGKDMATIDTMNVVPIDLNCLLYGLETAIAAHCTANGDAARAEEFASRADARRAAVERWLWDEEGGLYGDWDIKNAALRPGLTAATIYPLYTRIASAERASRVANTIEAKLVAQGGLRTSLVETGQQWDSPNGWAPLQWLAIEGLEHYGKPALAKDIAQRFLSTVQREYCASGKLLEKYNVEEQVPGGGGEYPNQDGFGWTNGVTLALMQRYSDLAGMMTCPPRQT